MEANYFTILYRFCHTSTWTCHGCTRVPYSDPPSHLPPHPIPLGHLSATALRTLYHASNLDWQFISHVIIHMFQCHSPKSSYPRPLPHSPKDCSIHLCLFVVSHTGLSLPSSWIPYICVSILYWQRRQWQPTPVLLPGKSHGQRSLVGCSPWGR